MVPLNYQEEVKRSLESLAQNPKVLFLGQATKYKGSRFTYPVLKDISPEKRIEVPIMEEAQMGMTIGLALEGYTPVSIYPRFDFLLLAANQLVNHLDKMEEMSQGQFRPKVIIRTVVGSTNPMDPGPQHRQNHTEAFKRLLTNVDVYQLNTAEEVFPSYERALKSERSSLLVEIGNYYNK